MRVVLTEDRTRLARRARADEALLEHYDPTRILLREERREVRLSDLDINAKLVAPLFEERLGRRMGSPAGTQFGVGADKKSAKSVNLKLPGVGRITTPAKVCRRYSRQHSSQV